jgi:hypothetical protein
MNKDTWKDYFEKTKNKPPRPLLVKAISFVGEKNSAIDLTASGVKKHWHIFHFIVRR